jgi:hypothetical protein
MPTNEVRAVLTQRGATALAQIQMGQITTTGLSHFRIGEGGYVLSGSTYFPKEPTNVQTVLDSDDPALIPVITAQIGHTPYVFQKALMPDDFTLESVVVARTDALVDFAEANDNGIGGAPKFFEIGLYLNNSVPSTEAAQGDGILSSFSFTLPALPVTPGSFSVSASLPVPQTAVDDGLGALVPGTAGVGGTIDYQTGAVTVAFSAAPVPGNPIVVAYSSSPLFMYGTFPEETKTPLIQILKISRIAY